MRKSREFNPNRTLRQQLPDYDLGDRKEEGKELCPKLKQINKQSELRGSQPGSQSLTGVTGEINMAHPLPIAWSLPQALLTTAL